MAKSKLGAAFEPWQRKSDAKPAKLDNDTSFGRRIRLAYIEARLFLDGEINTTVIRDTLSISRQQAMMDLHLYLQTYGQVARYNPSLKRWIKDGRRKPKILHPDKIAAFARYVESVKALAEAGSKV